MHHNDACFSSTECKNNPLLVFNAFLISLILIVFGLTAIPIAAKLITHSRDWVVPKSFELKIYALVMFIFFGVPLLRRWLPTLFLNVHVRFYRYLLFFLPITTIFYTYKWTERSLTAYGFVFAFSVIALLIVGWDLYKPKVLSNHWLQRFWQKFLLAIGICVFYIIYKTQPQIFHVKSWIFLVSFILCYGFIRRSETRSLWLIPLMLVMLLVLSFFSMTGLDVFHYVFYLGPVTSIIYGHYHPFLLDAQYGGGCTTFLASYFKWMVPLSLQYMQYLLKVLAFVQYTLIFFIAAAIYQSRKMAFVALLTILTFNFFSQSTYYYFCPSIGFMRFGFIYLILGIYLLQEKLSINLRVILISLITALAVFWSFESAIYTLPAVAFAELINKNLKRFLAFFIPLFILMGCIYFSPFIKIEKLPAFSYYYEYALIYASGFFQVPVTRAISFWWLFPVVYGYFLVKIMSGELTDRRIVALVVYGIALFTYYAGRADDNNIYHVSIPFILLSLYLVWTLQSISLQKKRVIVALIVAIFMTTSSVWVTKKSILKQIWHDNLPLVKQTVREGWPFFSHEDVDELQIYSHGDVVVPGCHFFNPLQKYIEHGTLFLLTEDNRYYKVYFCNHVYNPLGLLPFNEVDINPKARDRVVTRVSEINNRYLLVDQKLLIQPDAEKTDLTLRLLKAFDGKKTAVIHLGDATFVVFTREPQKQYKN